MFKNNIRIFSAWNRQKNKNIQPGPEKQHSYEKKKECNFEWRGIQQLLRNWLEIQLMKATRRVFPCIRSTSVTTRAVESK